MSNDEVVKGESPLDFNSKVYSINLGENNEKQKEILVSYDNALEECGKEFNFVKLKKYFLQKAFQNEIIFSGFGRFQIKLCFFGAFLILYVLNETMGSGFLMPASQCDLNLSIHDKGVLTAIVFIGE